jgi:hypothetical protein
MSRLFKVLLFLILLAGLGLVGFAYLGDLSPTQEDVVTPVEIDAG